jgi:uncharacterized protein (TIGR02611 family)
MNQHVLRFGRQIAIAVIGGAVLIVGIVLALPLIPGPGSALILLGLGILSLEFKRPRAMLARIKAWAIELRRRFEDRRSRAREGR